MTFSFVTHKNSCQKLELIETKHEEATAAATTTEATSAAPAAFKCKILMTSLSANNKFYWSFGDKSPFHFFKAYPVAPNSQLVVQSSVPVQKEGKENGKDTSSSKMDESCYVHPPVWGLCEVTETNLDEVPVGSVYRALLPMATEVQFEKAHVDPIMGTLVVHRPATLTAYNTMTPVPSDSVCHPQQQHGGGQVSSSSLALTCYPGIITGFGLYFALKDVSFHGCDTIVVTSASSKVSLAFALYMKDNNAGKKVIGYTSAANKTFCESTGLYSRILTYEEALPTPENSETPTADVVMIEVSGRGQVYATNQSRVKKLLSIGNASGVPDKDSTFASFTAYAKAKMMLTIMGAPKWIRSRMNPSQELFLIMDIMQELIEEWGKEIRMMNRDI